MSSSVTCEALETLAVGIVHDLLEPLLFTSLVPKRAMNWILTVVV